GDHAALGEEDAHLRLAPALHRQGLPDPARSARAGAAQRRGALASRRPREGGGPIPKGMTMSASKIMALQEMVARVPDGASLALGGSFLHRGPFAFVRELIRQGKKDLEIGKQSPGEDMH